MYKDENIVKKSLDVNIDLWDAVMHKFRERKEELEKLFGPFSMKKFMENHFKLFLDDKDPTMRQIGKFTVGGFMALGLIGGSVWGYGEYQLRKTKCSDFKTQAEAQVFFEKHNAKWLDRDIVNGKAVGDGIACESLPTK